ncbi:MAG: hypothetical protein ACOCVA_08320, partial [Prolixibacteraceae bacterium]
IKKERYGQLKTSKDDLKSMSMGIFNPKGRMRFSFGEPVKIDFEDERSKEKLNKQALELAEKIDRQIYINYKLWPNNYIAYDLLMRKNRFKEKYTSKEKRNFELMIEQAMIHIDFPITDIRERFLKIYATPVINKLKALA